MHRHFGKVLAALGTIVLCTSQVVGVSATSHLGHRVRQDFPPLPGSTPAVVVQIPTSPPSSSGSGNVSPRSSSLTPAQKQTALAVARADRYVRALVGRRPYSTGAVKPWTTGGRRRGALVPFSFPGPVTVSGSWPEEGRAPVRARRTNVIGLRIYVDLQRRLVESITPVTTRHPY